MVCSSLQIAGAILLPNIGGFVNGKITAGQLKPWYASLNKPSFNPPNWVFAPMWTSIYTTMGYASYLVWRDSGFGGPLGILAGASPAGKTALALYSTQLVLNMAWTPLFFKYHSFKWSLLDILALTGTSVACGLAFYRINTVAGYLFVPYVAWLSFATALNYTYWKLNKDNNEMDVGSIEEIHENEKKE